MGWPYHFEVSKEVQDARRGLIDKYGLIAQASAVLLLCAVGIYQWTLNRRASGGSSSTYAPVPVAEPSTPGRGPEGAESHEMQAPDQFVIDDDEDDDDNQVMGDDPLGPRQASAPPARSGEKLRRPPGKLAAWLNTPLRDGWKETRRHALGVGLWAGWVLTLCFRETGDDYLQLTRRFAHIGAALLPFHYLLGTSSRFSPLPKLFAVSVSATYNAFHRFHALLLFALFAAHASCFTNLYGWRDQLPGHMFDLVPFLGLCMLTTLAVLATLARQKIRYEHRPLFVGSHLLGAGLLPCLMYFHAGPAAWYAGETLAAYVLVLAERVLRTRETSG